MSSSREQGELSLTRLRRGILGTETIEFVAAVAAAVVRAGRYKTPIGSRTWCRDDVDDLVGDFFSKPGRIFDLAAEAEAASDPAGRFVGSVHTTVSNLIVDRLRRTPHGVLFQRIERRCTNRADIHDVAPAHWAIDGSEDEEHWGGDEHALARAVADVPVDPPPAWSGDRAAPVTTGKTVDDCCTAVLVGAAAPVEQLVVQRVVTDRILTDEDVAATVGGDDPTPTWDDDVADELIAQQVAETIWRGLEPDDQTLLPHVYTPSREVEGLAVLRLGHSAIAERQRKLKERVHDLLDGVPDGELVYDKLMTIAQSAGQPWGDVT